MLSVIFLFSCFSTGLSAHGTSTLLYTVVDISMVLGRKFFKNSFCIAIDVSVIKRNALTSLVLLNLTVNNLQ